MVSTILLWHIQGSLSRDFRFLFSEILRVGRGRASVKPISLRSGPDAENGYTSQTNVSRRGPSPRQAVLLSFSGHGKDTNPLSIGRQGKDTGCRQKYYICYTALVILRRCLTFRVYFDDEWGMPFSSPARQAFLQACPRFYLPASLICAAALAGFENRSPL